MKLVARACGRFGGLASLVCAGVGVALAVSGGREGWGVAAFAGASAAVGLLGAHLIERRPGVASLVLFVAVGPVGLVFALMGASPRQPSCLLLAATGLSALFLGLGALFSLVSAFARKPASA